MNFSRRFLQPSWLVVVVLAVAASVPAATYEVAIHHPLASDDALGTADQPWKTISKAAATARPGDLVVIHGGTYRERVVAQASGTAEAPIRFEAAPGEPVVLTGADRLTDWRKTDEARPIYGVAWPHKFIGWNAEMTHPNDSFHRVIGRCEQVVANGYQLRQVLHAAQLAPGAFFADVTNQTLFAWDFSNGDLNKAHVEASVRQEILRIEGDHTQWRGLRFCFAANMAQHGAVVVAGRFTLMEDCVFEGMNSSGATFRGEDAVIRRCIFRDNGQLGFGAGRAHRLLLTECRIENNNTKGFDRGWEAGGNKLALCRDATLERSQFVRNRGHGIWFDIGNTNCTVRNCLIADNEDAGIFYEISYRLLAHNNVIAGNGFATTAGAWGAQAGISLSSSPGCVIERNLIIGNREGFNFREQARTTSTIEDRAERAIWNHDQLIRRNLILLNSDAQLWGWFDVKDNRHWPGALTFTNRSGVSTTAKPGNIAAGYEAKSSAGQPQGLVLEELRLRFEENVYFAAPGQRWFKWGTTWAQHQHFETLTAFQSALRIDVGGRVFNPDFSGLRHFDLRLRPEVMELTKDCYPQGPIPGVTLGVR